MIYFITNHKPTLDRYQSKLYDNITALDDTPDTFIFYKKWLFEQYADNNIPDIVAFDVETNGLDAYTNDLVLTTISNKNDSFVFHSAYCNETPYYGLLKDKDYTLLGHNVKFDIKFASVKYGIFFTKVWDTMIAEQRLYMKSGLSFSLANLTQRYLDVYPDAMDKNIRNEFIGCNPVKFVVEPRHIYYVAGDGETLFPIKEKQELKIKQYNLEFLIYDIEFPLISIIAKAELTGFDFDMDGWLEVYADNVQKKFEIECKLDIEFRRLRDTIKPKDIVYIKGGKWDNQRVRNSQYDVFNDDGTTNVLDLFGEPMSKQLLTKTKKKVDRYPNNINYNSDTQIIEIFARLGQPLLTKTEQLVIPRFNRKGKIDKSMVSFQTNENAMNTYTTMLPNTVMKDFIDLLIEHRGLSTACNNFGINYKTKLNPVTGKLHTTFRQCDAATGRFQSGGGNKEPDKPNFQNIPSKAEYAIRLRNCFLAKPGHSICTHDLSGAELIIMCSLSQDLKLLEIATDDMHSYIAQKCWRKIYALRAHKLIKYHEDLRQKHGTTYTEESTVTKINEFIRLSKTYIVSKKENKDVREKFKPMGFGAIYGMYPKKAAKELNLAIDEGAIIISTIMEEFPDVFNMVLEASERATKQGYLVLNERTNSRAWFPNLMELKRGNISERTHFGLISKEQSEARNIRIQGTQADMIKECTVRLQNWVDDNEYTDEITILSWVHDEIVTDIPKYLDGKSKDWNVAKHCAKFPLRYISIQGKEITFDNFPALKSYIMSDVCNQYLDNVKMNVGYEVEPYWTK